MIFYFSLKLILCITIHTFILLAIMLVAVAINNPLSPGVTILLRLNARDFPNRFFSFFFIKAL